MSKSGSNTVSEEDIRGCSEGSEMLFHLLYERYYGLALT